MFALMLVLLASCTRKEEPKKDDFLGTPAEKVETPARIKVIESLAWTSYQILEVDGHEYLANNTGGMVHLESCPCKSK